MTIFQLDNISTNKITKTSIRTKGITSIIIIIVTSQTNLIIIAPTHSSIIEIISTISRRTSIQIKILIISSK